MIKSLKQVLFEALLVGICSILIFATILEILTKIQ